MQNIKGLAMSLGIVAAGALSVTAVAGGAALANHDITLTTASTADIIAAFDPALAEAWHATAETGTGDDAASAPLRSAQLGELVAAFNAVNPDNALDISGPTVGEGADEVMYFGPVAGAGTGEQADGAIDPTAYLFTIKDGVLAVNTQFDQNELTNAELGTWEHDALNGLWSQLNSDDTTGFGDIGTYYGGIASQQPGIEDLTNQVNDLTNQVSGLEADPWYIVGQDYNVVVDDFMGTNGGEFADLFSNADNVGSAGDLTVLFTDFGTALGF